MNSTQNDTVCAISTAYGIGGIAVIRVSGKDALAICEKVWSGADLETMESHTAHFGRIIDGYGELLDEVVLTLFRAPNSFTGEDVIEIACHGSLWIQQQMINLLIKNGCRMATGGEFTQRAFLNGKMDLSQAEAIADVIASSSKATHRIALNQMRGGFSKELNNLRGQLLEFVSLMELELDFSEEEVEFADRSRLIVLAENIDKIISRLADSFSVGNAIKNGIPVAIVGETNAGKSTLLNALLHDEKAIVSNIHGTTRDVIEDTVTIDGIMFRFIDTAGIRETLDEIESLGIERTFRKIEESSIVLWMIDGTTSQAFIKEMSGNILPRTDGKSLVAVVNKNDMLTTGQAGAMGRQLKDILPESAHLLFISAKQGENLQALQEILIKEAHLPVNQSSDIIVTNARHYDALVKAQKSIERVIDGLNAGISGDFVSQDIRICMHYLGEITGEISTTDILSTIFSKFCIGK